MLAQGRGGAIVITGSVTALIASASAESGLTASKGGLHAFSTRAWPFSTPRRVSGMQHRRPGALEQIDGEQVDLVAREKRLIGKIPMGRIGRFDEIAPMVAFLASNEASYCTGGVYVVDGGFTVQ